MELIHTYQTKLAEIQAEKFDVFIASCGYQSRCNFFLTELPGLPEKKYVFVHNEHGKSFFRNQQAESFQNNGCEIVQIDENQTDIIHQYIRQLIQNKEDGKIKMLVDYSCMPFQWYNQIVETILQADPYLSKAEIYFAYIPAFMDNQTENQKIKKFLYTTPPRSSVAARPKALIIDLGLSSQITNEIIAHFQPADIIYFIANEKFYKEKASIILNEHWDLLKATDENKVISYYVDNLEETMHKISSQCLNLRLKYHVTVVSNGFKPFKLATMLLQQQYADVSLCDIQYKTDRKNTGDPLKKTVICKTVFLPDDIIEDMEDADDITEPDTIKNFLPQR